ncbi:murein biosynthesis integral membrane protein MurJ [Geobacillus stearothermophilus]|nr:murein biosynthesis integral membrane protein MurJ [Geobacillus stearothermophilus]
MSSTANKATKSVLIILIFLMIGKVLGLLRDILIAAKFGSGVETDIYFVATTASTVLVSIFGAAVQTALVPILSDIDNNGVYNKTVDYLNNLINLIFIISLLVSILIYVFAESLVSFIATGFTDEQFKLAVSLTRIGVPMTIFISITSIFTGFLQYKEKFLVSSIIGVPYSGLQIIFLIFFSYSYGIKGLMVATVIATLSQIIIQLPVAYKLGYSHKFGLNIRDPDIKKFFILAGPIVISTMVEQINKVVDRSLASTLVEGSISALTYADKIKSLIINVFIVAIVSVIFPILSKMQNSNKQAINQVVVYSINAVTLIIVPITIGAIVLSTPITQILFQRGEFDAIATKMTASALVFYSMGLLGFGFRDVLNRVFYSMGDTKTPMKNGIIAILINIILNFLLVKPMGHVGLALATSISSTFSGLLLFVGLRKNLTSDDFKDIVFCFLKSLVSSLIMGTSIYVLYLALFKFISSIIISLVVVIIFGLIIYCIMCNLLKVNEFLIIKTALVQRFKRNDSQRK